MTTVQDIQAFLTNSAVDVLEVSREDVTPTTPLVDIGMTSFYAVLLCGMIEDEYEIEVEPLLMFECRTIAEVSEEVLEVIKHQK